MKWDENVEKMSSTADYIPTEVDKVGTVDSADYGTYRGREG